MMKFFIRLAFKYSSLTLLCFLIICIHGMPALIKIAGDVFFLAALRGWDVRVLILITD